MPYQRIHNKRLRCGLIRILFVLERSLHHVSGHRHHSRNNTHTSTSLLLRHEVLLLQPVRGRHRRKRKEDHALGLPPHVQRSQEHQDRNIKGAQNERTGHQ